MCCLRSSAGSAPSGAGSFPRRKMGVSSDLPLSLRTWALALWPQAALAIDMGCEGPQTLFSWCFAVLKSFVLRSGGHSLVIVLFVVLLLGVLRLAWMTAAGFKKSQRRFFFFQDQTSDLPLSLRTWALALWPQVALAIDAFLNSKFGAFPL